MTDRFLIAAGGPCKGQGLHDWDFDAGYCRRCGAEEHLHYIKRLYGQAAEDTNHKEKAR